jgi:hypothetical protein
MVMVILGYSIGGKNKNKNPTFCAALEYNYVSMTLVQ